VAVRSAGFPAERYRRICDPELAAAADAVDDADPSTRQHYAQVWDEAVERLSTAVRHTAADDQFREAVTWQNPALLTDCLDKAAAGEPRNVRGRNHERTIVSYLQRYCLKNDTVGFFGPLAWSRIGSVDVGLRVVPGAGLLARRTTYFEGWAVDALGDALAARPNVWPWLSPRPEPSARLTGWTLRLPFQRPASLSAVEVRVLTRCDGQRTVRALVGEPADPEAVAALHRLRTLGAVRIDLGGPLATWPERELAGRLARIGAPAVREEADHALGELVAARSAVTAATGHAEGLAAASAALSSAFERITGRGATRRAGGVYAGRTLVYEDTIRDIEIVLGQRLLDALASPLGLVLDSVVWLANTVGERCEAQADQLLEAEQARSGRSAMPLLQLLTGLVPELGQEGTIGVASSVVDEVVVEFQQRWQRVLGLSQEDVTSVREHRVAAAEIADRAAQAFRTGPPRWPAARWHSPDLMVAGRDAAALARGEVDLVLGELHCVTNTVETRLFVAQHPEAQRLRAAATHSALGGRVLFIPRRSASATTTRMSRAPELMLPDYTYVSLGDESFCPPPGATSVSVLDLTVHRRGDRLVVRLPAGDELSLLEAIGDPLSALLVDAFRPLAAGRHRPRVKIDRLVLSREGWTYAVTEPTWAFVRDEAQRFQQARRWRASEGLPERAFYRVPVELKPLAVDFGSVPLVNLLGKAIRRSVEQGPGTLSLTEMLPDLDQLWLTDATGARYTAELRCVAVRNLEQKEHL
jgi:hypothetical protein